MDIKQELRAELTNILNYWVTNTKDELNGGFYGQIRSNNTVVPNAPKGAVLNTRILWTFSAAYRFDPRPEYKKMAARAYEYITTYLWDNKHGGLYWEVDAFGKPTNTRKQIYAQGFGVYAFSEYYRAFANRDSLSYARQLYSLIEKHSYDRHYGGYIEARSENWEPLEDLKLSDKDMNTAKSNNTHLHILEPYTNLYRVWQDDVLASKIKALVGIFTNHILNKETNNLHLFFDLDWTVQGTIISYGHDIEASWLMTEGAKLFSSRSKNHLLGRTEKVAVAMTDAFIAHGVDADGGVYYEMDYATNHLDNDRHWWPQAEAMVGFMNAYEITGDKKYLEHLEKTWTYIKNFIIDHKHGEWYWKARQDGSHDENEVKVGFWKCPYHNVRALIEVLERMGKLNL